MADAPRVLAIIPARGGSKRLPRKNVLPLAGKPLIAWTIEAALESGAADKIVVSSDDEEILAVAAQYAVSAQKRAAHLAADTASTIDVVLDVIAREEAAGESFDAVILLQPTSPLRQAKDIAAAYEVFRNGGGRSVVSVCEVEHPVQWCGTVTDEGLLTGFDALGGKRSQDYPVTYRLNGALYVSGINAMKQSASFWSGQVLAYKMPRDRSVDIDCHLDYLVCKALVDNQKTQEPA